MNEWKSCNLYEWKTTHRYEWINLLIGINEQTKNPLTLGEAYSSISLNQSGQQSKVGWLDTS